MEKIRIKRKTKRSTMLFVLLFILNFSISAYIGFELGRTQETPFVTLTMVYSSEKKSWIDSIMNDFFIYTYLITGKIVVMNFQPAGSRSMVISTLTGEIKPTILSPASSIWIDYLNTKLMTVGRHPMILEENTKRVIYSPIVIGTWKLYAENPNHNITGFESLLNIPFLRWSHTDPQLSNSGTMSVLMQVAAFLKKNTSDITLLDLWNPIMRAKMALLESEIPYYGGSTGFLAKKALDGTLDVFMVYENLIIDMNKKDIAIARGGVKAIYPEDGTLLADHPFCLLTADWITPAEYFVANLFLNFIQRPDIIAKAFKSGFRPIDKSILDDPTYGSTFNKTFTEFAGVEREIPCPIYGSNINYFVLEGIPELWTTVRATG